MTKSTLLHLRFPFSFFLMPVYLFAVVASGHIDWVHAVVVFIILHFMIYPASNGFNSYFDKDEQSIGGLKHPPKVSKELYWVSLILDGVALLIAAWISWQFALMLLIYGLASKAYSHPMIRLKKMPLGGLLTVSFFQGYFILLAMAYGINNMPIQMLFTVQYQYPAILSAVLLLGSYPMTQIYQHGEDASRGDHTLSLKLGILGTFHYTGIVFTLAGVGFFFYFLNFYSLDVALYFALSQSVIIGFFVFWYFKVRKDIKLADYSHTMRLNLISSLILNIFFVGIVLM